MNEHIRKFEEWTSTKQRRHNFYCTSTVAFTQETAIFALCVKAFRQSGKKRQAALLRKWFLEGDIPESLTAGGYVSPLNISSKLQTQSSTSVKSAIDTVGKSFLNKVGNHGGGLRGFGGALWQKYTDATGVNPQLFDGVMDGVLPEMFDPPIFAIGYNPDQVRQPNGSFAGKVNVLTKYLKEADFNTPELGIY